MLNFVLSALIFESSAFTSAPGTVCAAAAAWLVMTAGYLLCANRAAWRRYAVVVMGVSPVAPLLWSHDPFQPTIAGEYCSALITPAWVCLSSDMLWLLAVTGVIGLLTRSRRREGALLLAVCCGSGLIGAIATCMAGAAAGLSCV